MMSSSLQFLFFVTALAVIDAFRAPENSVGLKGLKTSLVVQKPVATPVRTPSDDDLIRNIITLESLEQVGKAVTADGLARDASVRKRWEIVVDKAPSDYVDQYWYNPTIHTFGNIGFFGGLHAAMAPLSTRIIDNVAYDGEDVRSTVAKQLARVVKARTSKAGRQPRVLDMCCGVGMSTRALQDAFPESEFVVGLDTSTEMIRMAGFLSNHLRFFTPLMSFLFDKKKKEKNGMLNVFKKDWRQPLPRKAKFTMGNAERTSFPSKSFDLVTIMYAFHEAPEAGRDKILKEAYRLLQPGGTLAVVDISTDYTPSSTMLAGEPYVLEYQKNIHRQLRAIRGFTNIRYRNIVHNHVGMWTLKRSN